MAGNNPYTMDNGDLTGLGKLKYGTDALGLFTGINDLFGQSSNIAKLNAKNNAYAMKGNMYNMAAALKDKAYTRAHNAMSNYGLDGTNAAQAMNDAQKVKSGFEDTLSSYNRQLQEAKAAGKDTSGIQQEMNDYKKANEYKYSTAVNNYNKYSMVNTQNRNTVAAADKYAGFADKINTNYHSKRGLIR